MGFVKKGGARMGLPWEDWRWWASRAMASLAALVILLLWAAVGWAIRGCVP